MRLIIVAISIIISEALMAQLNGVQWVLGYDVSILDFRNDTLVNYPLQPITPFIATNANISDENGNLLYFTNGIEINDRYGNLVQNGDTLSPCLYTYDAIQYGLNIRQAALFLPKPGDSNYYYLFHFSNDSLSDSRPGTLYHSVIEKKGNNGLGAVTAKNVPILSDVVLRGGGMTACKHANGRDYWLVMGASVKNEFYKFLITPDSILGPYIQTIGPQYPGPYDNAYSKFSEDGSKYVTVCFTGYVLVMDFDRCSGEFSNPVTIYNSATNNPNEPATGGVAVEFSPNARFVYVSNPNNLTQYDLQASNIQDSVVVYYNDTDFYGIDMLQLAPNGKLYCSTWNGGSYYLHVVNYPNEPGNSCEFIDTGIVTLTNNTDNLPNLINYALGALVGSGCDTILSVSSPTIETEAKVCPNPARDVINLVCFAATNGPVEFELIDQLGEVVMEQKLSTGQGYAQYSTATLSTGIYYWRLKDNNRTIKTDKVAIIK